MIKLYHCRDSRSLRCMWLMEEMNLPYELQLVPFPPRIRAPEFLQINPTGTVPYLIDGETTMQESAAILEYLGTRYRGGALVATVDEPCYGQWLNLLHFGENALTVPLALLLRFSTFEPEEHRSPRLAEEYTRTYLTRLGVIDSALRGHEFLCADRFTVADISVGYALYLAGFAGLAAQHPPAVNAYFERLKARPAFAAALRRQKPPKPAAA